MQQVTCTVFSASLQHRCYYNSVPPNGQRAHVTGIGVYLRHGFVVTLFEVNCLRVRVVDLISSEAYLLAFRSYQRVKLLMHQVSVDGKHITCNGIESGQPCSPSGKGTEAQGNATLKYILDEHCHHPYWTCCWCKWWNTWRQKKPLCKRLAQSSSHHSSVFSRPAPSFTHTFRGSSVFQSSGQQRWASSLHGTNMETGLLVWMSFELTKPKRPKKRSSPPDPSSRTVNVSSASEPTWLANSAVFCFSFLFEGLSYSLFWGAARCECQRSTSGELMRSMRSKKDGSIQQKESQKANWASCQCSVMQSKKSIKLITC